MATIVPTNSAAKIDESSKKESGVASGKMSVDDTVMKADISDDHIEIESGSVDDDFLDKPLHARPSGVEEDPTRQFTPADINIEKQLPPWRRTKATAGALAVGGGSAYAGLTYLAPVLAGTVLGAKAGALIGTIPGAIIGAVVGGLFGYKYNKDKYKRQDKHIRQALDNFDKRGIKFNTAEKNRLESMNRSQWRELLHVSLHFDDKNKVQRQAIREAVMLRLARNGYDDALQFKEQLLGDNVSMLDRYNPDFLPPDNLKRKGLDFFGGYDDTAALSKRQTQDARAKLSGALMLHAAEHGVEAAHRLRQRIRGDLLLLSAKQVPGPAERTKIREATVAFAAKFGAGDAAHFKKALINNPGQRDALIRAAGNGLFNVDPAVIDDDVQRVHVRRAVIKYAAAAGTNAADRLKQQLLQSPDRLDHAFYAQDAADRITAKQIPDEDQRRAVSKVIIDHALQYGFGEAKDLKALLTNISAKQRASVLTALDEGLLDFGKDKLASSKDSNAIARSIRSALLLYAARSGARNAMLDRDKIVAAGKDGLFHIPPMSMPDSDQRLKVQAAILLRASGKGLEEASAFKQKLFESDGQIQVAIPRNDVGVGEHTSLVVRSISRAHPDNVDDVETYGKKFVGDPSKSTKDKHEYVGRLLNDPKHDLKITIPRHVSLPPLATVFDDKSDATDIWKDIENGKELPKAKLDPANKEQSRTALSQIVDRLAAKTSANKASNYHVDQGGDGVSLREAGMQVLETINATLDGSLSYEDRMQVLTEAATVFFASTTDDKGKTKHPNIAAIYSNHKNPTNFKIALNNAILSPPYGRNYVFSPAFRSYISKGLKPAADDQQARTIKMMGDVFGPSLSAEAKRDAYRPIKRISGHRTASIESLRDTAIQPLASGKSAKQMANILQPLRNQMGELNAQLANNYHKKSGDKSTDDAALLPPKSGKELTFVDEEFGGHVYDPNSIVRPDKSKMDKAGGDKAHYSTDSQLAVHQGNLHYLALSKLANNYQTRLDHAYAGAAAVSKTRLQKRDFAKSISDKQRLQWLHQAVQETIKDKDGSLKKAVGLEASQTQIRAARKGKQKGQLAELQKQRAKLAKELTDMIFKDSDESDEQIELKQVIAALDKRIAKLENYKKEWADDGVVEAVGKTKDYKLKGNLRMPNEFIPLNPDVDDDNIDDLITADDDDGTSEIFKEKLLFTLPDDKEELKFDVKDDDAFLLPVNADEDNRDELFNMSEQVNFAALDNYGATPDKATTGSYYAEDQRDARCAVQSMNAAFGGHVFTAQSLTAWKMADSLATARQTAQIELQKQLKTAQQQITNYEYIHGKRAPAELYNEVTKTQKSINELKDRKFTVSSHDMDSRSGSYSRDVHGYLKHLKSKDMIDKNWRMDIVYPKDKHKPFQRGGGVTISNNLPKELPGDRCVVGFKEGRHEHFVAFRKGDDGWTKIDGMGDFDERYSNHKASQVNISPQQFISNLWDTDAEKYEVSIIYPEG